MKICCYKEKGKEENITNTNHKKNKKNLPKLEEELPWEPSSLGNLM